MVIHSEIFFASDSAWPIALLLLLVSFVVVSCGFSPLCVIVHVPVSLLVGHHMLHLLL